MAGVLAAASGGNLGIVQYISNGGGASGTGSAGTWSCTPAFPAGIAAGDILICKAGAKVGTSIDGVDVPTGFTIVPSTGVGTGTVLAGYVFKKIATGSESGTLTVSGQYTGATPQCVAIIERYTGNEQAVLSATEASGTNSGTSTTPAPSSVTTSLNNGMAIFCLVTASATSAPNNISGETGGDYTEAYAEYAAAGLTISTQIAALVTAGTISGGTCTIGASVAWRVSCFAIKPSS